MRILLYAIWVATLVACTPAEPAPAEVVRGIYAEAAQRAAHNRTTGETDLPLTADFSQALTRASAAAQKRNEPFIDGDLALDCQECSGFANLSVAMKQPPANGAAVVEARFSIGAQQRVVIWDMRKTHEGWRVDNIRSPHGGDLRAAAQNELSAQPPHD